MYNFKCLTIPVKIEIIFIYHIAIEDTETVIMAPPLDWNPTGHYGLEDMILNPNLMPDAMRIRVKRGGGGVKSQVIDDAVLNYNKIEANTTPRSNEGMYILAKKLT